MQTVSKLTNGRNNCTNTNHTGSYKHSLMSYCRTATFLSRGSTREVMPPWTAWLGTGGRFPRWWCGGKRHPLWTRIYMCSFSALGTQWRLFSFCWFCLALQIGGLQGFGKNFPKLDLPQLRLVSVVLASHGPLSQFLICLATTSPRHCWRWRCRRNPACLLWVSPYSSVSFLLCYTPHLKATFYTFVTGRFHEDSSIASISIYVYTVTGDPQMGDQICISVATGLQPWERGEICSPLQLQMLVWY